MSTTKTECGECFGTGYYRGLGPDACPGGCKDPDGAPSFKVPELVERLALDLADLGDPLVDVTAWVVPGAIGRQDDPTRIVRVLKIKGLPNEELVSFEYLNPHDGAIMGVKMVQALSGFCIAFKPDPDWVAK